MPTAQKSAAIESLRGTFSGAAAIFLADFTGLNVADITDLRRKCRENGVQFTVVKNTLAIKATRALELSELEPHFQGPTAVAVSADDPTSPARVLLDFRKGHEEKPQVKIGFVEGRILDAEEVKALAALPTRDQLISQVMQLAMAPAQNLVYALNDTMTRLVRVTDAVREAMEKGTIASASGSTESGGGSGAEAAAAAPAEEAGTEASAEAPAEEGGAEGGEEKASE
jgi:large subunit ribosomal protein L10